MKQATPQRVVDAMLLRNDKKQAQICTFLEMNFLAGAGVSSMEKMDKRRVGLKARETNISSNWICTLRYL